MKALYSKEELIEKLQQLAKNLGKNPTRLDVEIEDDFPSPGTFVNAFGSFNNALTAAGLKASHVDVKISKKPPEKPQKQFKSSGTSDEQFLDLLRLKASELGHSPTWLEITLDQRFPSPTTLAKRFGTYNNAILAAGLKPNEYHKRGKNHHSPHIGHQKAP